MTTRPTWSAWFENNHTPQHNQQEAPPLPTSTLQPEQYGSHNSYYQPEYDDRPRSYFPTNDQYLSKAYEDQTNSIPLRSQTPQSVHSSLPYRADSYYGSHADDDSPTSHARESSRPFIQSPDIPAQENYYRNGPNMDGSLSPSPNSSTPYNVLPPPIVVVQGAALTSNDKAMLNPDVQKQLQNRRSWRPWFSWSTALIMTAVLFWELYQNKVFTGNVIETGKGGQAFNIMIGPSAPVLVHVGARFVPCMRETIYTTKDFICLNATDLVPSNGKTADPNQICPLESWCGFNGFPNGVPNQWFRFITPIFIHGGVVHLLMNMIMQLRIGAQLERDMGPFRFSIIYMTSGIMGFIFGGNFAPRKQTSMGASGALFGLIGCLLVDLILNWRLIVKPGWELAKLLILVLVSFAIGLLQWFDNFSHIGGFFTGILTGILFMPAVHFSRGHRMGIWIARAIALPLLVVLIVLGITNFENNPDPGATCTWCRYFSCLPVDGWCDAFNESP